MTEELLPALSVKLKIRWKMLALHEVKSEFE